ncbi:MAG: succinylglutamate desuccinylase/aspartoacylase family protein [Proteobacteria bacterium]|nr:succinylglutamate desuccinylase/aspartoacylase family protein [Pseudomonadota bacterium]
MGDVKYRISAVIVLICVALAVGFSRESFIGMRNLPPEFPGEGVTEVRRLSDYFPALAGSAGDTEIYILKGKSPGASMLILGGTHPNEAASNASAVVMMENLKVAQGALYIITKANRSGFTHNDPTEGYPQGYPIDLPDGSVRMFPFGSRATNPIHQWPDPDIYIHSSGQTLSGAETRNLNRAYPGNPDGNLTEQVAYAIVRLIKKEKIDLAVDLHEASPEYPVINAIVAHDRAFDLAAMSVMELDMEGLVFSLEPSPSNLRGLSHREWGDFTDTMAMLMESTNAVQGRLRGRTDVSLIVKAKDPYYVEAYKMGRLYVDYPEEGHPIEERVGRHVAGIKAIVDSFNALETGKSIVVEGFPGFGDLMSKGLGHFLTPAGS